MSEIAGRVKKIVIEHLGVEDDKVVENASFIDDLGADSLDTVELVMAFEEEFGCATSSLMLCNNNDDDDDDDIVVGERNTNSNEKKNMDSSRNKWYIPSLEEFEYITLIPFGCIEQVTGIPFVSS